MKRIHETVLFLAFNICLSSLSFSQPAIEWQNTIGGSGEDDALCIKQTADKGFIIAGFSNSNASGDKSENNKDVTLATSDYWIVKTDSDGNVLWQNTIGGSADDLIYSIQQTSDGGYILGGRSSSNISGDKSENNMGIDYDYWIVKIDAAGSVQWQNTIGGDHNDELYTVVQTSDGGYILGGSSESNTSGDKTEDNCGPFTYFNDYWIIKTDDHGNIQWQNTIGGDGIDGLFSIHETTDGGFILGGYSDSDSSGDKTEKYIGTVRHTDFWIVKTNSTGNIQWQNTIGGDGAEGGPVRVQQTTDGGYIVGGLSISNISGDKTENNWDVSTQTADYWIVKLDPVGNIQWQNTIGGSGDDVFFSIEKTTEGGYILGGMSSSGISGDKTENCFGYADYWIVKTDALGNLQWENTLGGDGADFLTSISETNDGGYILAGTSNSSISGDKTENSLGIADYWIVKLAPDSTIGISEETIEKLKIKISPNPFTNELTVQCEVPGEIKIYDVFGRIVHAQKFSNRCIINTETWNSGIYFVEIQTEKGRVVRKVVKQ